MCVSPSPPREIPMTLPASGSVLNLLASKWMHMRWTVLTKNSRWLQTTMVEIDGVGWQLVSGTSSPAAPYKRHWLGTSSGPPQARPRPLSGLSGGAVPAIHPVMARYRYRYELPGVI